MHTKFLRKLAALGAIGTLASWLAACNRTGDQGEHAHDGGEPHQHEARAAQITVWTNGYEIFAEYQAPVVGKPTT